MGFGISITSGAGAVMSFSFAMIMLTSCRNTMERLKQTVLEKYVPFESAIDFHGTCAWTALVFTGTVLLFIILMKFVTKLIHFAITKIYVNPVC